MFSTNEFRLVNGAVRGDTIAQQKLNARLHSLQAEMVDEVRNLSADFKALTQAVVGSEARPHWANWPHTRGQPRLVQALQPANDQVTMRQPDGIAHLAASATTLVKTKTKASIDALHTFKAKRVAILDKDVRTHYLKQVSLDSEVLSAEQKAANRHFQRAILIVSGMGVCMLVYPPLLVLPTPFFLYMSYPFYKKAVKDLWQNHKVTTFVLDVLLDFGSLIYTPFKPQILFISMSAGLVRAYTMKIIAATKDGTRKNLTNLMGEQPKSVWIVQGENEVEVNFATVQSGDLLVIDAGQMVPVDGCIERGMASIDQHMLTGEAQPAEKGAGDAVLAATIVLSGRIFIRVEKTGQATAAAQIGQMLLQTADFTSSIELRGLEISDRMAPPTLALSALALAFLGPTQALTMLVTGLGYNMRLLGPIAVLNYLQLMAIEGILIKDGRALEQLRNVDTVVFDKTGTLTLEQPHVGAIHGCNGYDEAALLCYAATAEQRQTHPIAKAIVQAASARALPLLPIDEASYQVGYGIQVTLAQKLVHVGSNRFMNMAGITIPAEIDTLAQAAHAQGHSLVYVAVDQQLAGAIELHPTVRPEAQQIVDELHRRGLALYIISGDNERPTRAMAEKLGIDHYFAETLPENKADLIAQLQAQGKFICFVGDGINDSIALKKAQVSISLRGATTIATDTAQIILMDATLNQLTRLFTLADEFEANMQTNLLTTIVPGVVIIGGVLLGVVGYGSALALFWVGGITGVINAMRPLFQAQKEKNNLPAQRIIQS